MLVRVPVRAHFWVCLILTNTKLNSAVTHLLFNYTFQKLFVLHWQGKCQWSRYLLFFRIYTYIYIFFLLAFWFRGFVFECDFDQVCDTRKCLQVVVDQEIWCWVALFEKFTGRNCWVYDGCAWEEPGPRWFILVPVSGGGEWRTVGTRRGLILACQTIS